MAPTLPKPHDSLDHAAGRPTCHQISVVSGNAKGLGSQLLNPWVGFLILLPALYVVTPWLPLADHITGTERGTCPGCSTPKPDPFASELHTITRGPLTDPGCTRNKPSIYHELVVGGHCLPLLHLNIPPWCAFWCSIPQHNACQMKSWMTAWFRGMYHIPNQCQNKCLQYVGGML